MAAAVEKLRPRIKLELQCYRKTHRQQNLSRTHFVSSCSPPRRRRGSLEEPKTKKSQAQARPMAGDWAIPPYSVSRSLHLLGWWWISTFCASGAITLSQRTSTKRNWFPPVSLFPTAEISRSRHDKHMQCRGVSLSLGGGPRFRPPGQEDNGPWMLWSFY